MVWGNSDKETVQGYIANPNAFLSQSDENRRLGSIKMAAVAREYPAIRTEAVEAFSNSLFALAADSAQKAHETFKQLVDISGQTAELKKKLINAGCGIFSVLNNNDPNIFPNFVSDLLQLASGDLDSEEMIVKKTCSVISQIAVKNSVTALSVCKNLLSVAERRPKFGADIIRSICEILPSVSAENGETAVAMFQTLDFAIPDEDKVQKGFLAVKGLNILLTVAERYPSSALSLFREILSFPADLADGKIKVQQAAIQRGCDLLGTLSVSSPATAVAVVQAMFSAVGEDRFSKRVILIKGSSVLPIVSVNAAVEGYALLQSLASGVGDDDALREIVIKGGLEALKSSPPEKNAAVLSFAQQLFLLAGDDEALQSPILSVCRKVLPEALMFYPDAGKNLLRSFLSKSESEQVKEIVEGLRDSLPVMSQKSPEGVQPLIDILMPAAAGDDSLRESILKKAFFCVLTMAKDNEKAGAVVGALAVHVADDIPLRRAFLDTAAETLPSIAGNYHSPGLISAMEAVTANDKELSAHYIEKTLSVLPDVVFRDTMEEKDDRIALPVIESLVKIAATNTEQRTAIFEKLIEILPLMTEKNPADARDLVSLLAKEMSDRGAHASLLIKSGGEILERVTRADYKAGRDLSFALITAAGNDKDRLAEAVDKSCDILRIVAEKDAQAGKQVYEQILSTVSIDANTPAIFADVACTEEVKNYNSTAIILRNIEPSEKQIVVWNGASYVGPQFEAAVKEYTVQQRSHTLNGHFKSIFNFVAASDKHMSGAPFLKDVIRDRLKGKEKLQPLSWDSISLS